MNRPDIQTTKQVVPMLYGYSTPEVVRHNGWTKIGYTEQDVETRINQQTHTADIKWQLEWKGNATFDDGSGETFIDKDFHVYLRKSGIEQEKGKIMNGSMWMAPHQNKCFVILGKIMVS